MLKTIEKKLNKMAVKAQVAVSRMLRDESGMEIIQVLILLALGLALIGVFIGFQDQIMGRVQELVDDFLGNF